MAFFGRYIEVTPPARLVWTNEEGGIFDDFHAARESPSAWIRCTLTALGFPTPFMVDRYLRTMDDDLFHIIGAEWAPRLNIADTVKGGVIASDAGIKLQSNLQRLESFAEAIR
jgi:hypothetical protein